MSFEPKASLIIVSRDRPDDLARLLTSLKFQSYPNFEVIVVTNTPTDAFIPNSIQLEEISHHYFDAENISAARNLGIAKAAGEIIAFCDDDAIPEPHWLSRLIAPFENAKTGVSGGFVRGRNGISYQWKGLETDTFGNDHPININAPLIRGMKNNRFLKVQGTNCAFRRDAVLDLGGFDENYAFYLDETDLCLRLAYAGWDTAIIPSAQVQHGFAASDQRHITRAPKSLYSVGKSKKYFLNKHNKGNGLSGELKKFKDEQHARLCTLLIWGQIEPKDFRILTHSLEMGLQDSSTAGEQSIEQTITQTGFKRFHTSQQGASLLFSSIWNAKLLHSKAKQLADQGIQVTAMCLSRTSIFHKRYFHKDGYWMQTGGVFGKSNRNEPYVSLKYRTLYHRAKIEAASLSDQRDLAGISPKKV